MIDFFISCTAIDKAWAEWIAWVLEEAKHTARIQAWDFRPGSNFVVEMDTAAREAERTLLVLSPDYPGSAFGKAEWAAAFVRDPIGEKGLLLPVRVREVSLDGLLAAVVAIDLVGHEEAAAREMLLAGLVRGRVRPVEPPLFPGGLRPRFPADLAALPADEIPSRGPLPAGSRMPLAVNRLFVGRQDDLLALARRLRVGDTSAVGEVEIAAASGLGGIGKTQLAAEFVHRYGRFFPGGVFWMSFAAPAAVPAEVAACGRSLDLRPAYDALPLTEQIRLVEEAWTQPIPRLLVFDNCEDEALLDRWRPRFGGARVLVTSWRSRWDKALGVHVVPLGTLPRPVSLEFLQKFRPDVPAEDPSLSTRDLLLRTVLLEGDDPAAALGGEDALRRLIALGLLEEGREGALVLHRLVAELARGLDEGEKARAAVEEILLQEAESLNERGLPFLLLGWQAHLRAVTERALGRADAMAGRLCNALGHQLWLSGDLQGACRSVRQGLVLREMLLGPEHPDTADSLNNLGILLGDEGDYAAARPCLERALAIREKVLGPEHPDTAQSLNNLGTLLQSRGDLAAARPYYERSLRIVEKVLGPEDPSTAASLSNLGLLLEGQGDLVGAREYCGRALAIREKVLGPKHPDTAASLNNLGFLLQRQGDFAAAETYLKRALKIREEVLGPEHPDSAASRNNLGFLFYRQGDLATSLPYYERALEILEKVSGPDHPDTAASRNNLGALLQAQSDLEGARRNFEQALKVFEARLGPDHPNTHITRGHLEDLGSVRR